MTERFMWGMFCDDIRQELTGKLTIVGCYSGEMFVPSFPFKVPKICVHFQIVTSKDRPFQFINVRLKKSSEVMVEVALEPQLNKRAGRGADDSYSRHMFMGALEIPFLEFTEECILELSAETEEGVIVGPKLRVKLVKPLDSGIELVETNIG